MNRLQPRWIPTLPMLPSASARRLPTHTSFAIQASLSRTTRGYSNGSTSSPKSAEGPSATSGGSRSKDAVESGSSPTAGVLPDTLADGDARGRTGSGKPLESSCAAAPQPKISKASVPGQQPKLTPEQQAEADEHNREFESKHAKADPAEDDKVDKSFWSGTGSRSNKE
ncbi:a24289a9-e208-4ab7-ad83-04a022c7dced [Thermothielavioides terrestris]|uniref:A24289a9-e208-4ab7-ad83-04a022c7dced n=1 Tax=Thermothielavioides terrestris TaxID=2587410 RepID=A0A446BN75_9PEZI|nr:a24289a9-e208-4ab7-ad83-04a022c7dced [Thermothielavioides terrestris]